MIKTHATDFDSISYQFDSLILAIHDRRKQVENVVRKLERLGKKSKEQEEYKDNKKHK